MTVYAIHAEKKYVKVGYTSEETPDSRRATLQTGNPLRLEVYNFNEGGTAQDEAKLHQLLNFCKLEGEWFEFEAAQKTLDHYFGSASKETFFFGNIARLTLYQVAKALKVKVSVVQSLIEKGEIISEGDVILSTEFQSFVCRAAEESTKEFVPTPLEYRRVPPRVPNPTE